ncbi:MAG TPA: DUF5615 family PIN-like protein [Anaerolineae bacterium]|nr:DUF5615 family PIN-like protein [Anaerolineae bacterium]
MDEDVPPAVTHGLQLRGIDVLTTKEAGMLGARDEAQLHLATGQGRVLFSQDEDFLALHEQGVSHTGIAYAPQQTFIGAIVRGLLLIYDVLAAEDMRGRVEFL